MKLPERTAVAIIGQGEMIDHELVVRKSWQVLNAFSTFRRIIRR